MERIRLDLIGVTYNQIESGVYAVVLQEHGGTRRIPIIIGFPEAQAIECKLQEVITPRPLTHDLMVNTLSSFGVSLQEARIYKMENGVFGAELILSDGVDTHVIDSRSSDAIALAIRVGAPIYTTEEVIAESNESSKEEKAGGNRALRSSAPAEKKTKRTDAASRLNQLKKDMQKAAEAENYEEAARLKAEIERLEAEKAAEEAI